MTRPTLPDNFGDWSISAGAVRKRIAWLKAKPRILAVLNRRLVLCWLRWKREVMG